MLNSEKPNLFSNSICLNYLFTNCLTLVRYLCQFCLEVRYRMSDVLGVRVGVRHWWFEGAIFQCCIFMITMNTLFCEMLIFNNIWSLATNCKQIFHAFVFNIRNYSPEVAKWSWILYYRGWIILILNKKRHGTFVLFYATNTKQDLGR